MRYQILFIGFVSLVLLTSCGGSKTLDIDQQGDEVTFSNETNRVTTTVDEKAEEFTIEDKESGAKLEVRQDLPKDFPSDVPVVAGKVQSGALSGLAGAGLTTLTITTEDSLEKVAEFYKKGMVEQGWTLTYDAAFNENPILSYEKDDRQIQIMMERSTEGGARINLMLSKKF